MISNAPEFLANIAHEVYEADPIYFDTKRAWRDMPWEYMMVRETGKILLRPSKIWDRFKGEYVSRDGSQK